MKNLLWLIPLLFLFGYGTWSILHSDQEGVEYEIKSEIHNRGSIAFVFSELKVREPNSLVSKVLYRKTDTLSLDYFENISPGDYLEYQKGLCMLILRGWMQTNHYNKATDISRH